MTVCFHEEVSLSTSSTSQGSQEAQIVDALEVFCKSKDAHNPSHGQKVWCLHRGASQARADLFLTGLIDQIIQGDEGECQGPFPICDQP